MDTIGAAVMEWILGNSWKAVVLLGVVLVLRRMLSRRLSSAWCHALWWIVMLRLVMPSVSESHWSVFHWLDRSWAMIVGGFSAPGTVPAAIEVVPSPSHPEAVAVALPTKRIPENTGPQIAPGDRASVEVRTSLVAPDSTGTQSEGTRILGSATLGVTSSNGTRLGAGRDDSTLSRWAPWLAVIWLAGFLGMAVRLGFQHRRFTSRLARGATPPSTRTRELFERCRARMGVRRKVRLVVFAGVDSPALYGVFRPVLLLPDGWESAFSEPELTHVFLHELAHVRRGDLFSNALAVGVGWLHWFNPLVRYALRCMRLDRELAADAMVLDVEGASRAREYGRTIVRVVERWVKPSIPVATVGILDDPSEIAARVKAIAGYRRPVRRAWWAGCLLLGFAWVGWTDPATSRTPDTTNVLWKSRFIGLRAMGNRTDASTLQKLLGDPETQKLKTSFMDRISRHAWSRFGSGEQVPEAWRKVMELVADSESLIEVQSIQSGASDWAIGLRAGGTDTQWLREWASQLASTSKDSAKGLEVRDLKGWFVFGRGTQALESIAAQATEVGTGPVLPGTVIGEGQGHWAELMPGWDPDWKPVGWIADWPFASWKLELANGRIRSWARLRSKQPVSWELPEWKVPTNLVRDPLVYFAAHRGSERWFERLHPEGEKGRGGWPKQVVEWAMAGPPWQQYFAAPSADPRAFIARWAEVRPEDVLRKIGILSTKLDVRRAAGGGRVDWVGLPYFQPFLAESKAVGTPMVVGGLFPAQTIGDPMPEALMAQLKGRPDLIAYEWETTGSQAPVRIGLKSGETGKSEGPGRGETVGRLRQLKELDQFRRLLGSMAGGKAVLGPQGVVRVPGSEWIDAMASQLGDTITEVRQTGPSELEWVRRSQLGLNAREWMALLAWISDGAAKDSTTPSSGAR